MGYLAEMKLAKSAAVKAGAYLKDQTDVIVESTIGKDIKLAHDIESEKIIIDGLSESGIPILSEECGEFQMGCKQSGMRWIVDPLDGTANYLKGFRELTCVSIALWNGNIPILGVVYRYHTGELFYGSIDTKAYLNDVEIYPSDVRKMKDAVLTTGFPLKRNYETDSLTSFVRTVQEFKKIRMLGAAALMGTFVACGKADAYTESNIMLWDIAAATAIVSASGGVVSVEILNENQCVCELFANRYLYEEYRKTIVR